MPLLVATDVRKEFGGLVAVNGVDFQIPKGSIVSLIGPNGAGKTTFFNMLTGVYKPTGGQHRLRRRGRHRQAAARDHASAGSAGRSRTSGCSEHDGARERARRHALAPEGQHLRVDPAHARDPQGGGGGARARAASCSRSRACAARTTTRREQPLVRRPAPARGRARARDAAEAAAARRADRRHEPAGDRGLHARSSRSCATRRA